MAVPGAATRSSKKGGSTGGRYAYVDTDPQLGILIELLEFDKLQ